MHTHLCIDVLAHRVDPSSILLKNTERVLLLPDLDGKEEVGVGMHHIAYRALTLRCLHPI